MEISQNFVAFSEYMNFIKAFGMINLHYEIRICQKIYNRVTTHNKRKCLVRNSLHQTLGNKIDHSFSNSSNGWCATCDPNANITEPGYCGPEMATVRI